MYINDHKIDFWYFNFFKFYNISSSNESSNLLSVTALVSKFLPPIFRIVRCYCFAISVSCSAYLLVCFEICGVFTFVARDTSFTEGCDYASGDGSLIEMSGDVFKDVECPIGSKSISGSRSLVMSNGPPWGPGGLSRECAPPYPQRDRKRRLNGAVCRNHRIKRLVPCRCLDGHVKEPYEMSMALGARP